MNTKLQILDISRQNNHGALSPWFDKMLDQHITNGRFVDEATIGKLNQNLITMLENYRIKTGVSSVVIGMSGGVDSALTAALFKKAGWYVFGVLMPILQNEEETDRGRAACLALGIVPVCIDLTQAYRAVTGELSRIDSGVYPATDHAGLVRQGNVRARLRMITLYNLAAKHKGLVASTDNFSELAAGFWTLHGDVGDLSPIQSLYKSWEVPLLSKLNDVPESVWRAKPTDGLGIAEGDEAQFGFTYLEFDIVLAFLQELNEKENYSLACYAEDKLADIAQFGDDTRAREVFDLVTSRMKSTWFKRSNPMNLDHPLEGSARYDMLNEFDNKFSVKNSL